MTLSVCMITKNGAKRLPQSITSIKELADEIIVVDTGSKDESKLIASGLGAKVYDFEWNDDFSAAKNYAYSKATGDWILDLDDDEVISSLDYEAIKDLTKRTDHKAFYLIQRNYTSEIGEIEWISSKGDNYPESAIAAGYVPRKLVRLFKNDPRVKSEGRVHETTLYSIERIGTIGESSVAIHHLGSINKDKEKTKHYIEIQKKEEKQNFYSYYQIASQLQEIGELKESTEYLMKSINLNPNFHLSWLKLAIIWMQSGMIIESKPLLLHALKLQEYAPTLNHLAIVETAEKKFPEAIAYFERSLQLNDKNADTHYNFSQTLKLAHYSLRSEEELHKAMELNPKYAKP